MLLDELVRTSAAVAATSSRRAKVEQIASLLRRTAPAEVPVAVAFLAGELRQRQIGVGYASLRDIIEGAGELKPSGEPSASGKPAAGEESRAGTAAAAGAPPLTLASVDEAFAQIGAAVGMGSHARRRELLTALFDSASRAQQAFLVRLLAGDLRQGALEGVMIEAIASAAGVPADEVRRAHLLGGSLLAVAEAALAPAEPGPATHPEDGTRPDRALAALRAFRLRVGRPLQPMLAGAADSVGAAFERICPAAVEWKIDGIRVQVHKDGTNVAVFTRTLDDITARVPEVAAAVTALPARQAVLDGEVIALSPAGRPLPFQVTAGRAGSRSDIGRLAREVPLTAFFFDLLHLDGDDLLDAPGHERYARLAATVHADLLIPRTVTADVSSAETFYRDAVARGHEGVLVKSLDAPYAAGRRGVGWIKVKPRHTLDLVVLAAEWGHGRRRGWLSNLHLGARDPVTGGNVMLGKTFKGLTDETLAWQTGRLLELADPPRGRSSAEGMGVARGADEAGWTHGDGPGPPGAPVPARSPPVGGSAPPRDTALSNDITAPADTTPPGGTSPPTAPPGDTALSNDITVPADAAPPAGTTPPGDTTAPADTAPPTDTAAAGRIGPPGGAVDTSPYGVVRVRPELVVEIAFDGVQASRRYPGGIALRFARVIRYRPDKRAAGADTIETVRLIAAAAGVTPDPPA